MIPLRYFALEALRSMFRSGALALVAVASLSLAALTVGAWGLLLANHRHWQAEVGNRVQAVAYFKAGLSREATGQAFEKLKALPGLGSAALVWPEDAAKELAQDPALKAVIETLAENPLPASARLHPAEASLSSVKALAAAAGAVEGVSDVDWGAEATEGLLKAMTVARQALLAAAALLAGAALLVVALVVRLTAHQRRNEISIMRLVGADPWFIRAPFLLEGLFQGALAGLLASVVIIAGLEFLRSQLRSQLGIALEAFFPVGFGPAWALGLSAAAALLGALGSALAFSALGPEERT